MEILRAWVKPCAWNQDGAAGLTVMDDSAVELSDLELKRRTHASDPARRNEVAVHELAEPEALFDLEDGRISFLGHPGFGLNP